MVIDNLRWTQAYEPMGLRREDGKLQVHVLTTELANYCFILRKAFPIIPNCTALPNAFNASSRSLDTTYSLSVPFEF
jgi:hypothetical protein